MKIYWTKQYTFIPILGKNHLIFFWNVLLDSSIISLSSKLKVTNSIAQKLAVEFESSSLHKVIKLRNVFAHHQLNSHPTLIVKKDPKEDGTKHMLHTISWSGKVRKTSRQDALEEFNSNYEIARNSLKVLIEVIKSRDNQ